MNLGGCSMLSNEVKYEAHLVCKRTNEIRAPGTAVPNNAPGSSYQCQVPGIR